MDQDGCKDVGSIFEDRFGFVFNRELSEQGCGDIYQHPQTGAIIQVVAEPASPDVHVDMWESAESWSKGEKPLSSMNASQVQ